MTCQPKSVGKMVDFEILTLSVSLNSSEMCTYICKDLVTWFRLYLVKNPIPNPQGEHFHFLKSGGSDLASSLEAKFRAMKPNKMEKFEIQRQNLGYLSPIFGANRPNSRKGLEFEGKIWGIWGKFLDNCHPYFRRKNLGL